jgi:hypothetical protein
MQCAASNAPRYERRLEARDADGGWSRLHRLLVRLIINLGSTRPSAAD